MFRRFVLFLSAGLLPACVALPDWPAPGASLASLVRRQDGASEFRFDWRLSGDRAVAPLQVFDDGRRTWMQFAPGQPVPAIFEVTAAGERLLSHRVEGPYVVLRGVWPRLALRGGHQQSRVERMVPARVGGGRLALPGSPPSFDERAQPAAGQAGEAGLPAAAVTPATGQAGAVGGAMSAASAPPVAAIAAMVPGGAVAAGAVEVGGGLASALTASSFSVPLSAGVAYRVSPHDVNIRLALVRWARQAGWTFEPEHWAADIDIPISGSAVFETDFKQAVQQLVAATELAERPLQPCFYSNRVLRVVPFSQSCDRGLSSGRPS